MNSIHQLLPSYLCLAKKMVLPSSSCDIEPFSIEMTDQKIDVRHHQKYTHLLSSSRQATHGCMPSYQFVISQALTLAVLNHSHFTLSPLGLVHKSWRWEKYGSFDDTETFTVRCHVKELPRNRRFRVFSQQVEFWQYGREVSRFETIFFKVLEKIRTSGSVLPRITQQKSLFWNCSDQELWKYVHLSGDWNPIHLFGVFSRMLGFSSRIIHGMFVVGKYLQSMNRETFDRLNHIECEFQKPCYVNAPIEIFHSFSNDICIQVNIFQEGRSKIDLSLGLKK
ncbi:MAG: MaoC/PaaZ C-terminal domain-containing protein [Bdellovibrionota bacterium]